MFSYLEDRTYQRGGRSVHYRFPRPGELKQFMNYSSFGKIGLVGSDAPLWGTDRFLHSPILDENTSSHIAIGRSLSCALSGTAYASPAFLDSIGYNQSKIHIDIPFGSSDVSVVATKSAQGEVTLLDGGVWGV